MCPSQWPNRLQYHLVYPEMWFQFDASDDPEAPGSRECHSLDAVGKVLYLFGGNDQQQRMNAILTLNTGAVCVTVQVGFDRTSSAILSCFHHASLEIMC